MKRRNNFERLATGESGPIATYAELRVLEAECVKSTSFSLGSRLIELNRTFIGPPIIDLCDLQFFV